MTHPCYAVICFAAVSVMLSLSLPLAADEPSDIQALRSQIESLERRLAAQEQELAEFRRASEQGAQQYELRMEQIREMVADVLADADFRTGELTFGWDRGFRLRSADGNYQLRIGGVIQPRYEFRSSSAGEDTSSFTLNRARLDFRGHLFTEKLTFRIYPEFAHTVSLRDAWIDYAFDNALQVRFGQFTIPFHWHRYVNAFNQHFVDRSLPSETFGFPSGRDLGVMAHGQLFDDRVGYGVAFLDGAGRNIATSNSDGNMVSGRLTWAMLGSLPREESDQAWSEQPQLSLGGGLQSAWRNERRPWALGRSPADNDRADWIAGTLDSRFAWRGFSIVVDGYLRHVDPQDVAVDRYDGWAYAVSAGYFIVPEKYEIVGRWSQIQLDRNDGDTRRSEWGLGLTIYHRGHDWKTRFNYLNDHDKAAGTDHIVILEHHLQF